jgi:spermidine synthase
VLVLDAGTGNDVAVAIDEGATRIDAVEIDPVILALGRAVHPDHPYRSATVHTINTDARSFLNASRDQYDLIVFGTLDSMTRLSALSNVRLDNFVYTRECLAAARRRLAPGGGLVMYFMAGTDYISWRLMSMVAQTFDERPLMVKRH